MEILEGHNKFYVNDAQGNQVAEIVFVPTGEHLSIIEHTDVDPSLKGQGVGKQLVAKVVEKCARSSGRLFLSARLPNMNSITPVNTTIFAPDVPAPV
ncbi:GNAT family N-acetyltransferase [Klebsiella quasipneumoniae subsp. similipneumoniae]|nr:GNAT family N-acetyltransferase [Klebsiella quasipneumoniae subsp. similipneumoniae]